MERDLLSAVKHFGSEISHAVKQRAAGARGTASAYVSKGKLHAQSVEQAVGKRIQARPIASLVAAAGFGVIMGTILGRRRK